MIIIFGSMVLSPVSDIFSTSLLWMGCHLHIHFNASINNPTPMKIIPKFLMAMLAMKVVNGRAEMVAVGVGFSTS